MKPTRTFRLLPAAALVLLVSAPAAKAGLADGDLDPAFQDAGKFAFDADVQGRVAVAVGPAGELLAGYTELLGGTDRDMRFVPIADQGAAQVCGFYFPDQGGTNEDNLHDLAVDGGTVYLAGTAAGPSGDPDPVVAVASFTRATCQKTDFGGEDGVIVTSSSPLEGRRIALTPEGTLRVAAQRGAGNARELRSFGINAGGIVDGGFLVQSIDFQTAFGAEFFEPHDMIRQPDGKIVVVGTVEMPNGDRDVGVVRFLSNGVLDGAFSGDGLASFSYDTSDEGDDEGNAVALLHDGRIAVAGSAPGFFGTNAAIAVLNPTGTLHGAFGTGGRFSFSFAGAPTESDGIAALATQGDGRIVAVGTAGFGLVSSWAVARFDASSATPLDTSFSEDGKTLFSFDLGGSGIHRATDVTLGQGGKISVVGIASVDGGFTVAAARVWSSYVFVDGFEWGSQAFWSSTAP
jgi:uncharacterized delta-60 repeat protein